MIGAAHSLTVRYPRIEANVSCWEHQCKPITQPIFVPQFWLFSPQSVFYRARCPSCQPVQQTVELQSKDQIKIGLEIRLQSGIKAKFTSCK